ncbi:PAAR domain-containing protein [Virgisporangium aurantiacum]|uniref:PAAR motif protein n=1 Tax=Virgisporangium aurantiacum TaxID=175570 RepID=A0A8J3Z2S0_9ACTN|nr:PAAR domain-containing protein [Virgisporangium aurantiacum]GIJ55312.1 PAAR motif protein [Virgisporangium aurantiacum]
MGQPAARQNDQVTGTDTHLCVPPSGPPVPTPLPFVSLLQQALSGDVFINGLPAATQDSISKHTPPHIPPPPMTFSKPPTNQGKVLVGSQTVLVNNKPLARVGDAVMTCNDPVDAPVGTIASGSPNVLVG